MSAPARVNATMFDGDDLASDAGSLEQIAAEHRPTAMAVVAPRGEA
jgi:hypothetical protein